jgi:hypothetical protein
MVQVGHLTQGAHMTRTEYLGDVAGLVFIVTLLYIAMSL